MVPEVFLAVLAIILALIFDFTNGFHDSANQVATVIKTNAMPPRRALLLAAMCNFIGAYFLGTAVAETLGRGIVDPTLLDPGISGITVIISALLGAIIWNFWTWYGGIPSSSSHALIGGLLGAFVAGWGYGSVNWEKAGLIFVALLVSPLVGFLVALVLTKAVFIFGRLFAFSEKWNRGLNKCQVFSLILQALSHGTNDAQKTMGVITFVLVIAGMYSPPVGSMPIPAWVIIICALAIAFGTLTGGWRVIKTLGWRIYDIKPVHAFASQFSSASIIYGASLIGLPISTTQVISSSVIGSGAGEHPKRVHWEAAKEMGQAWLATIPASASISAGFLFAFRGLWVYAVGMVLVTAMGYMLVRRVNIFKIFPETKDFRKMLIDQAQAILDGLKIVKAYCGDPTPENAKAALEAEDRADKVRAEIVDSIRNTFVTGPFDRHNLENLSQKLDDIIDEAAKKAILRMVKFKVPPDEYLQKMAGKLVGAAELLKEALETLTTDARKCQECINAARKKENAVQHLFEDWYSRENPDLGSLDEITTLEEATRALRAVVKCRGEEKVQVAFMKAADKIVEAAAEIEIILAKIS